MGGSEGSRGYLYQGMASAIEALLVPEWDKIYVEYPSENDKVDIALELDGLLTKSIQVKSTIDSFQRGEIISWITTLTNDKEAKIYELFLIGNCSDNAVKMIKSIRKYHDGIQDKETVGSLKLLPAKFLDNHKVNIAVLPCAEKTLSELIISALHKYCSKINKLVQYDCLDFMARAMVCDQIILSISHEGCTRNEFESLISSRINLLEHKYSTQRVAIGIKSFQRGAESLEAETATCLCLLDKYDGRLLKPSFDWNKDIIPEVEHFIKDNTHPSNAYALHLDTHSSIAFAAGRFLDTKSGINIFPIQKTLGKQLWQYDSEDKMEYPVIDITSEYLDHGSDESVLILNITKNIYGEVLNYLIFTSARVGRVINCKIDNGLIGNSTIINGTHCVRIAESISEAVHSRNIPERRSILHIFASAPNALLFFLGRVSRGFGQCTLYEYDFEQRNTCSYYPTITIQ